MPQFIVAPADSFDGYGNLTTLAGASLHPSTALSGLVNGSSYRAVALSSASDSFSPRSDVPEAAYLPAGAGTPVVAIGARRLIAAYSGPLFRVQRASDNAQMDVAQLANGAPDDAAAVAWAAGAEMRLAVIYDQAGSSRNFVPGSWAEMPLYDPAALYGASAKYGVFNSFNFDSWLQTPSTRRVKWARWPAGVAANRQAISVFDVSEPRTALYNSVPYNFTATNGATTSNLGPIIQADLPGIRIQHFSPHTTFSRRPRQNMQVIGLVNNSSNMRLLQDGQILTGAAASAQAIVGGTLGVSANGNAGTTDYIDRSHRLAFVVYGTALSDANATAVRDALNATFGISAHDNQVVLVGSSSLFGASVTTSLEGRTPVRSVRPSLVGNPALYNMGLSSQRLTGSGQLADLAATREDLLAVDGSYGRRVLFIQIGANDINSFGNNPGYAATLYSEMTAYISARRAAGFTRIVLCTIPPRTGFQSGQTQTEWLAYNDLVRANSAGADVICDLASHPVMGLPASVSDLALYQDGIHPTGAGNDLVALTGSPVGGHPVNYRDALNQALAG